MPALTLKPEKWQIILHDVNVKFTYMLLKVFRTFKTDKTLSHIPDAVHIIKDI